MTDRSPYYFGTAGAFAPLALFAASIVYVTTRGMITIQAYFAPLVMCIGLIIVLARDRRAATEAMLNGVRDRALVVMIVAFLGAGVFGQVLVASGLVETVVWLGQAAGVGGTLFVLLGFLVAAVISTSIGTSTGTVVTCVPILYPAGVVLGAHPALILGAIYSGARFGDNIAPISDTTIASAYTQGAEVGDVVRTRLKYALVAGAASLVLYVVAGAMMPANGESLTTVSAETGGRRQSLAMLLAPAVTIGLCLKGRTLIHALWFGIFVGIGVGLVTGTLSVGVLYTLEPPRTVGGVITSGLLGMRDVVFLVILIMAMLGALREAGALDETIRFVKRFASNVKRTEFSILGLITVLCPLCAGNTQAMLFGGPVVKELGEQFDIALTRRANLMDLAGNGITENLPHINTILALAGVMVVTAETTGVPVVPLTSVGALAFHPMMLSVVAVVAIVTGWGRTPLTTGPSA